MVYTGSQQLEKVGQRSSEKITRQNPEKSQNRISRDCQSQNTKTKNRKMRYKGKMRRSVVNFQPQNPELNPILLNIISENVGDVHTFYPNSKTKIFSNVN